MNYFELINSAVRSLQKNRVRSFLTMLGIVVSISATIVIYIIGESLGVSVNESFTQNYGTNIICIETYNNNPKNHDSAPEELRFTRELIDDYEKNLENMVSAIFQISGGVAKIQTTSDRYSNVSVVGVNGAMESLSDCDMVYGRFISDRDCDNYINSAVISDITARECFDKDNPVGEYIYMLDEKGVYCQYVIVGVYRYIGNLYDTEADNMEYLNSRAYVNYKYMINNNSQISVSDEMQRFLVSDFRRMDYIKSYSEEYFNKKISVEGWKYRVIVLTDEISRIQDIIQLITYIMTVIAVMALLIGGLGIMNIMLVTVNERTREIGVKLALGASRSVIVFEVISESVIMSVAGSLAGIASGLLLSFNLVNAVKIICNLNSLSHIHPVFAVPGKIVLLAFIFSVFTGVVFGVFPAVKASRKNIVDALRTY